MHLLAPVRAASLALLLTYTLSSAPQAATGDGAGGIYVRSFDIRGNTGLPSATLTALAAEFSARRITDAELKELLRRLTAAYAEAGYATSRAVVPDQELVDGVIRIDIVEGFLEQVVVTGNRAIDANYVSERLRAGITTPLNVALLNANVRLLMQERGIADIRGELRPGTRPGAAILHAYIEEQARFGGGMRVANDRAPAVGGVRGAIEASARNVLGFGDVADLIVGTADGLRDLDFRFNTPLNAHGTSFSLRYFKANSELVEEQFAVVGAETDSKGIDLGLSHLFLRSLQREAGTYVQLVSKQSQSRLGGRPFSFSPGVENGHADVKVARLGLSWLERTSRDVLNTRVSYSIGIGAFGATRHDDGLPDSRFHSVLAQLQWLHQFGPRAGSLFARADGQFAQDPLLPLEKFAVGGTNSVRGYRRSRFVRDSGWSASVEYRLPLLRLAIPEVSTEAKDGQISLVLFADAGRAWNHDDPDDGPETLLAGGPGLRWDVQRDIRAEFYWGGIRRHVSDTGGNIQDRGLHFIVSARRSF